MKPNIYKDVDWSLVDGLWVDLTNRQIAQRLGGCYSQVAIERKKRISQALASGQPAAPFERVRPQRDWSQAAGLWTDLTNRQIAQWLGISNWLVANGRRMLIQQALASGQPTTPFERVRPKPKAYDWSPADRLWTELNNREIAQRLGIPRKWVDCERRTRIAQALASGQSAVPFWCVRWNFKSIDWRKADGLWRKLNSQQIAHRLGVAHWQVAHQRRKLIQQALASGQPATPFQWGARPNRETIDWSKADGLWPTMRNAELAKMLGVRYGRVWRARQERINQAKLGRKSPKPYIYQG